VTKVKLADLSPLVGISSLDRSQLSMISKNELRSRYHCLFSNLSWASCSLPEFEISKFLSEMMSALTVRLDSSSVWNCSTILLNRGIDLTDFEYSVNRLASDSRITHI
jgi:hypothetical protein